MEEAITNKVANSNLEMFDLEDYYPQGIRTQIDISQWSHYNIVYEHLSICMRDNSNDAFREVYCHIDTRCDFNLLRYFRYHTIYYRIYGSWDILNDIVRDFVFHIQIRETED
jgi:hypothetical protein